MYSRMLAAPSKSFFLFGPRATGKSTWIRTIFPRALLFDLLHAPTFTTLIADPSRLEDRIPNGFDDWIVIDEVQKAPAILDEVHRLMELRKFKFALTGSSARKLKKSGVNLLAGRAVRRSMFPLTCAELKGDFRLKHSLQFGHLPQVYSSDDPADVLFAYVQNYITQEVQHEGLTRNIAAFARFLEAASLSQASLLNISEVARECGVERKIVEDYFSILEDLMIAQRITPFAKRAKRAIVSHPKFFFFDVGVFRTLRPQGFLDSSDELDGPALETLVYQELRAHIDYTRLKLALHFWRSRTGDEVDFVLYGADGFKAIEVKRTSKLRGRDFDGLRAFHEDFPEADRWMLYGGKTAYFEHGIQIVPVEEALKNLQRLTSAAPHRTTR